MRKLSDKWVRIPFDEVLKDEHHDLFFISLQQREVPESIIFAKKQMVKYANTSELLYEIIRKNRSSDIGKFTITDSPEMTYIAGLKEDISKIFDGGSDPNQGIAVNC